DPVYAERAAKFATQVEDITAFLVRLGLNRDLGAIEETVTYQEPCHLAHAQKVSAQPREVLRAIPGLTLVEMQESSMCCGSAGIYNLTNPGMSKALQQRKLDNATATP